MWEIGANVGQHSHWISEKPLDWRPLTPNTCKFGWALHRFCAREQPKQVNGSAWLGRTFCKLGNSVDEDFTSIKGSFDTIERTLDRMGTKLDSIIGHLTEVEQGFDKSLS